jgi:hypothetical protein
LLVNVFKQIFGMGGYIMQRLAVFMSRRLLLTCAGVAGLFAAMMPYAQARLDPAASTLEHRRAILDERVARANAVLERQAAPPTAGERVAQWPNWPNYWGNWPNWRNF